VAVDQVTIVAATSDLGAELSDEDADEKIEIYEAPASYLSVSHETSAAVMQMDEERVVLGSSVAGALVLPRGVRMLKIHLYGGAGSPRSVRIIGSRISSGLEQHGWKLVSLDTSPIQGNNLTEVLAVSQRDQISLKIP